MGGAKTFTYLEETNAHALLFDETHLDMAGIAKAKLE